MYVPVVDSNQIPLTVGENQMAVENTYRLVGN
jgi:hypothetical protein